MKVWTGLVLLLSCLFAIPAPTAAEDTLLSGDHIYRQMIAAMSASPEPQTLRCRIDSNSKWITFSMATYGRSLGSLFTIPGNTETRHYVIASDTAGLRGYAERIDPAGTIIAGPISGTIDAAQPYLHPLTLAQVFGFVRTYGASGSSTAPSPLPSGDAGDSGAAVIGRVRTFTDYTYAVTNLGRETLDGAAVYHLHFVPRHGSAGHPLTDVLVDTATLLPLRMESDILASATPAVHFLFRFDFARVGAYWIAASQRVQGRVAFGPIRRTGTVDLIVTDAVFDAPIDVPSPRPATTSS